MRAGTLRNVGMLQNRSESRDDYGGQVTQWIDVCKVRFSLENAGGHEIEVGGGARAQSNFTIGMRWMAGVVPTMRVAMNENGGTRFFNFTNVNDVENRHRELEITVIEGVSPGD